MTRRVTVPALVGHHLRSRPAGGFTIAALVLILSFVATAGPIALGLLADTALRDRLGALGPLDRGVESAPLGVPQFDATQLSQPPETDEVWGGFLSEVESIRADASPPLDELLGTAHTVSFSRANPVAESPLTRELRLAFDPAYEDDIRIVDGRLPEAAALTIDDGAVLGSRIEVVLSAATAAEMEWSVGESRTLGFEEFASEIVLTGTFDAVDPGADHWQHVTSVLLPNISDDGNRARKVIGTAIAHPASLPASYALNGPASSLVWYPLETDRIEASTAEETAVALRKFTSVSHAVGSSEQGVGIPNLRFTADVTTTIELAIAEHSATTAIIAMTVAGPVGVAVAVLILGCRLMLESRRSSARLLSARGASIGQLRGLLGLEGVVVGVVPATVGAAVAAIAAAVLWGVAPPPTGLVAAVLLGLAPLVILWVLAASAAERQTRVDLGRRGSRLRLIVEGAVVVLAAASVVLLFVRGYSGGLDPLLAAAPLLLALVACLVTLRLHPIPLLGMLERARRSSGVSSFLGAARAVREPAMGLTPVLALVVGVSVTVSSGILLSTLQGGVARSAQAQVGADVRVTGAPFTRDQLEQVRALDGVAAATGISGAEPAVLDANGVKRNTSVFVVDATDLREVQADGPGLLQPGVSLEPKGGAMPLLSSAATADLIDGSAEVSIEGVDAVVVGVARGPTPVGARENWVAIDASYAEDVVGRDPNDRILLVRLDDGASADAVEASLTHVLGPDIRIDTSDEIGADLVSRPAVQGVRWALLAATAIAALLSALAIVMTLTLAAGPRARVTALLRTLGAPPRVSTALALWEIGPPAIAAVIAGSIFGALVPLVVLAGVDLRPFTASTVQPAYQADATTLAVTIGGFVLLAVLLTAVAMLVSQHGRAESVLRIVEEG